MGEIAHRVHGGAAVGLVEPFERLVKREQGKVRAQRSCERAPPPHPAGELRGGNGETVRKPEPGEHFARLALFFPSGGKPHVFQRRELRAEPVLLKNRRAARRNAGDLSGVRRLKAEKESQQRRFPAAGNAGDDGRFPERDPRGKIAENDRFSVAF